VRFLTAAVPLAALVSALALAAAWTVRAGWSDLRFQEQTLPATERAIALTPGQESDWVRLALLVSDDDPARAIEALETALALNPLDAQAWIELGLRFEAGGKLAAAERCLLRAASADRGYLPRWSLANYYFRRNDAGNFWRWGREAAAMAYGDPSPLFRLASMLTGDGSETEDRLGLGRPSLQAAYLRYLLDRRQTAFAARSALRLDAWNRPADTALLLETCDRLLVDHRPEEAMELWNRLSQSRRIPYSALAPEAGVSLTNASFASAPLSRGFDWRLRPVAGASAALEENPPGIRVSFSGRQPESCELLSQFLPVEARSRYTLQYLYRSSGVAPGTGLRWLVLDGDTILARGDSLSADRESPGEFSFATPARCRFVHLILGYERASGTTRIEGSVLLRSLSLTSTTTPSR
jgi:tetratricopeptide (TPR) repeat protein